MSKALPATAGFGDGGGDANQGVRAPLESGKGRETGSALRPPERSLPFAHLDSSPGRPRAGSDPQNCKVINVDCFEPLSWC